MSLGQPKTPSGPKFVQSPRAAACAAASASATSSPPESQAEERIKRGEQLLAARMGTAQPSPIYLAALHRVSEDVPSLEYAVRMSRPATAREASLTESPRPHGTAAERAAGLRTARPVLQTTWSLERPSTVQGGDTTRRASAMATFPRPSTVPERGRRPLTSLMELPSAHAGGAQSADESMWHHDKLVNAVGLRHLRDVVTGLEKVSTAQSLWVAVALGAGKHKRRRTKPQRSRRMKAPPIQGWSLAGGKEIDARTPEQRAHDDRMKVADELFNHRQTKRHEAAERLAAAASQGRARAEWYYPRAVFDVYSNRLIVPHVATTPRQVVARKPVRQVEKKIKFVFAPRAKWCDSKDVFDTDECELKRFEIDWERACALGIAKLIEKRDDDGAVDEDNDGVSDEVTETKAILWDFHDLIVQHFEYYASLSGQSMTVISLGQWIMFCNDFELASAKSKHCKKSDLDTLFLMLNSTSNRAAKEKAAAEGKVFQHDVGEKALDRVEFIMALVHVAINRYVLEGKTSDVSSSLFHLLAHHFEPRVDKVVFKDYNEFRRLIYEAPVNAVLVKHEHALRAVYEVGCGMTQPAALMSLSEWTAIVKGLGFMGPDFSNRECRLCFIMSRMAVIDGRSAKGQIKEDNLPFEGFLEAICRMSTVKAFPTAAELQELGCVDAGSFLLQLEDGELRTADGMDYIEFRQTRGHKWGQWESGLIPEAQSLAWLVECTVNVALRVIERHTQEKVNLKITKREVKQWANTCVTKPNH